MGKALDAQRIHMASYLIGDVQGCSDALQRLAAHMGFSPSRDTLYLLGDLVNRGPDSVGVLRQVAAWGDAARFVWGNHDLHALAVACGARAAGRGDTLDALLQASDRDALLETLRRGQLALHERGVLMVHAGVLPQWSATDLIAHSLEWTPAIRQKNVKSLLQTMYGNQPAKWDEGLKGVERLRVVVNACTRLRFCSADGEMEFATKEGAGAAPTGFMPWFDVPGRRSADAVVAFGHWSTLGALNRANLMALDTGCVWGGCLSAVRLPDDPNQAADLGARHWFDVPCVGRL
jgi:bis(5'-nucleosyl)-tetraphosphatase (symmetrical)